jgi:hypothetical protein
LPSAQAPQSVRNAVSCQWPVIGGFLLEFAGPTGRWQRAKRILQ